MQTTTQLPAAMHTSHPHALPHGQGTALIPRSLLPIPLRETMRPLAPGIPAIPAIDTNIVAIARPSRFSTQYVVVAHVVLAMEAVENLGTVGPRGADVVTNGLRGCANHWSVDVQRMNVSKRRQGWAAQR